MFGKVIHPWSKDIVMAGTIFSTVVIDRLILGQNPLRISYRKIPEHRKRGIIEGRNKKIRGTETWKIHTHKKESFSLSYMTNYD